MATPTEPKHGPTLRNAGLTSGSTRAKAIRGENDDRGEATLEDIESVERVVPPAKDRERGTSDAQAEE